MCAERTERSSPLRPNELPLHPHTGCATARFTLQLFDAPPGALTLTSAVLVPLKTIVVRWLMATGPKEPVMSPMIIPELGQTCAPPAWLAGRASWLIEEVTLMLTGYVDVSSATIPLTE